MAAPSSSRSRGARLSHGAALLLVSLAALTFVFTGEAQARKRRGAGFGFRARLEGAYGWVTYDSHSVVTNANTSVSGNEFSGRLELELWPTRMFGAVIEGAHLSGDLSASTVNNFRGKPITQEAEAASLAVRVIGGDELSPELVLIAGAQLGLYSDVRAYVGSPTYDLVRVHTFGGRLGARARIPFTKELFLDVMGAFFQPTSIIGAGPNELEKAGSHSITGSIAVEYRFKASGVSFGGGVLGQRNSLEYKAQSNIQPQELEFNLLAPMIYVRFSL